MTMQRRDFLTAAGAFAAGVAAGGLPRTAAAAGGPPADLRVAVIGLRGRGQDHLRGLKDHVVAVCDCDRDVLDQRAAEFSTRVGRGVQAFVDYRDLLAKADVDAVSIATPNHTHTLIAVAAIEAGKDVYVEKPVSHNVWEGRQLVAAARRHNRVVQCGTQSRSSPSLQQAVAWVRSGQLGPIEHAIGTCYKPRPSIGKLAAPLAIPETLHYDLWCGPAERRDLYRPALHYDWHWDFNTGNGDTGNQGIHQMDIARWFLGEDGLAPRTMSIGGRLGYDDAGDTPNTQVVVHAYERAPLVFETRGLPRSKAAQAAWGDSMDRYRGAGIGVIVQCEGGHVLVPSYSEAIAYDRAGREVKRWSGGGDHYGNWLEAIAERDPSRLAGEIREGHVSSALCHVGCVSHQVGDAAAIDDIASAVAGDPLVSASLARMAGHLRANGVAIDNAGAERLTLGPWLEIDPASERFVGPDAAKALHARDQQPEFAVPDYDA